MNQRRKIQTRLFTTIERTMIRTMRLSWHQAGEMYLESTMQKFL